MNVEKKNNNTNIPKIDYLDDESIQVACGEDLFVEICENAIKYWLESHEEEIMEKIVDGYNLQPKKKKAKVTKDIK